MKIFVSKYDLLAVILAFSAVSSPANSQPTRTVNPGFVVDRLSFVMTGSPADSAIIDQYVSGRMTLMQIADLYKQTPGFERRLAEFWTEKLSLKIPTLWNQIYQLDTSNRTVDYVRSITNSRKTASPKTDTTCVNSSYSVGAANASTIYIHKFPTTPLTGAALLSSPADAAAYGCTCDPLVNAPRPKLMTPWWAPGIKILACPSIDSATYCDAGLKNCMPTATSGAMTQGFFSTKNPDKFFGLIAEGFTMEPGFLIAKTVVEDRSWDEVLTSPDSTANSAMLAMLSKTQFNTLLFSNAPAGTYANISRAQYIDEANADPQGEAMKLASGGREFTRYERGGANSGVLTTPAFHLRYNGPRAKVNASRIAFLCKEFTVPSGIPLVPSDEQDLTKRPYCQMCHSTIEPMTKFWGRWPQLGSLNYKYDASIPADQVTGPYCKFV